MHRLMDMNSFVELASLVMDMDDVLWYILYFIIDFFIKCF